MVRQVRQVAFLSPAAKGGVEIAPGESHLGVHTPSEGNPIQVIPVIKSHLRREGPSGIPLKGVRTAHSTGRAVSKKDPFRLPEHKVPSSLQAS